MKQVFSLILLTVTMFLPVPTNGWTKAKPPILKGPDAIVPLLLQCFKDGGYPCSSYETVAAAYQDKDTEDRLDGVQKILCNQDYNGKSIQWIQFKAGKIDTEVQADQWYNDMYLREGYGEPLQSGDTTNDFLMYCCFRRQFIEGGEGASRMLREVGF